MSEQKELVEIAYPDYVRSAKVPRKIHRELNGRKSRKGRKLTKVQKTKNAEYARQYRAKNRDRVNTKRRENAKRERYLNSAIYRESIKRFSERRAFISKNIDPLYKLIYIDGIDPDEARQLVNSPTKDRYHLSLQAYCKLALDNLSTMANFDVRKLPANDITKNDRRRYTRANY